MRDATAASSGLQDSRIGELTAKFDIVLGFTAAD
jgi:hypothetical protein